MKDQAIQKLNPRKVFWQKGACSHAMFHLLNHEFGNIRPREEKACDMLAGGIAQKGHQCGMIWGAALASGTESYRRYKDRNMAVVSTINASRFLMDSFYKRTGTVNCRDISQVDWDNRFQFVIYMLKTIASGFVYSTCFNLIVKWTPEALDAAAKGLSENPVFGEQCLSCAGEVVRKMGGTEEESVMVAGFAGGLGLSGNACGALSAAIWYKMLHYTRHNPEKSQSMFDNPDVKKIIRIFYMQTDSEMLCKNICNRTFDNICEHTQYIQSGGCKKLIDALAEV